MTAYYNEIDEQAAQWLRNLIKAGLIAPGDVDCRSIAEVQPDDIKGYTQCHFFAGIGVWSYALRRAGWGDDRPVWTGSCPCQPFSAAGKRAGFDDERHLWPEWFRLISQCRPVVVFGEQVASKDALAWIDHVSVDLEAAAYAFGAVDTCAAGFGAPHIRQRLYFVARGVGLADAHGGHTGSEGLQRGGEHGLIEEDGRAVFAGVGQADAGGSGLRGRCEHRDDASAPSEVPREVWQQRLRSDACANSPVSGVAQGDADEPGSQGWRVQPRDGASECSVGQAGPVNGFWERCDWIPCTDGKARPVEPGTFPLVTGAPARVVRLRAYGNAINAEQAKEFIQAYDSLTLSRRPHDQNISFIPGPLEDRPWEALD